MKKLFLLLLSTAFILSSNPICAKGIEDALSKLEEKGFKIHKVKDYDGLADLKLSFSDFNTKCSRYYATCDDNNYDTHVVYLLEDIIMMTPNNAFTEGSLTSLSCADEINPRNEIDILVGEYTRYFSGYVKFSSLDVIYIKKQKNVCIHINETDVPGANKVFCKGHYNSYQLADEINPQNGRDFLEWTIQCSVIQGDWLFSGHRCIKIKAGADEINPDNGYESTSYPDVCDEIVSED